MIFLFLLFFLFSYRNVSNSFFFFISYFDIEICGDGTVVGDEECDVPFGPCCDQNTCRFKLPNEICRPAVSNCDIAENCTGISDECAPNSVQPPDHICRPSRGKCDPPETCTGSCTICPEDEIFPNGTICRDADQGVCDIAEECDGISDDCPPNSFLFNVTCRPKILQCDLEERCNGTSPVCPKDEVKPEGTPCEIDGLTCSIEECVGFNATCFLKHYICELKTDDEDVVAPSA